ncbi:unnamed protein product [Chondrus crispus]|uniref:Uncharacterized protein n=1 Tax=Chondrus crispus TaxID=2769 RepID=R7Q371_CHOCR|nr:unnamed protein product [Chondrus crispus]CDF32464.1 unnamed protein product [Chondrus crispus]|eukprot:XP_005712129.1 unnamed protein product [Chondrus crispus]
MNSAAAHRITSPRSSSLAKRLPTSPPQCMEHTALILAPQGYAPFYEVTAFVSWGNMSTGDYSISSWLSHINFSTVNPSLNLRHS